MMRRFLSKLSPIFNNDWAEDLLALLAVAAFSTGTFLFANIIADAVLIARAG